MSGSSFFASTNPLSFALSRLLRTGLPVTTSFSFPNLSKPSLKGTQMRVENLALIRVAKPEVMSLSWLITGIFNRYAAITGGTETKPPLLNKRSGLLRFKIRYAEPIAQATLKKSANVFREKYRLNFPEGIE